MVEPGETKVKAEEGEERKYLAKFNKKKHGKNNHSAKCFDRDWDMPELLKGVEFSMAKNGLDLYLKALEKLQLYTLTTYKKRCRDMKEFEAGKSSNLHTTKFRWKHITYTERDVENLSEQYHQVEGATWSKYIGNVWCRYVHMWSGTQGTSM